MTAITAEARAFRAGDDALLLQGIERAAALGGVRRTLRELQWRYGEAPHGARVAFARDERGGIRAGIAATRHKVSFEGQEVHWLEVGDFFNDFASGRGLSRARALLAAGQACAESFGGFAPEKHPVLYGLPDRRAHRFGLGQLEWEVLRSENELRAELARLESRAAGGVDVEEVERFPDEVALCFRRFAEGRAALIVRDAAYLNWRYGAGRERKQRLALARVQGELRGYAVYSAGWLMDWMVRPEEEDVAHELLAWAASRARLDGASLSLVVPDTAPEWLAFQRRGFRAVGTREYLCFRSFQRPAIMSWLFKNWFYTRGDTLR